MECAANTLKNLYEREDGFPNCIKGCNEIVLNLLKSAIEELETCEDKKPLGGHNGMKALIQMLRELYDEKDEMITKGECVEVMKMIMHLSIDNGFITEAMDELDGN